MVVLNVDGLEVDFPYEPYPCQLKYIESVVRCLKLGWNGILESPTGTGKTLCLLCAALAWQQQRKIQSQQTFVQGQDVGDIFNIPRIIYTSRTHSQLSQVVKELNKTVYRNVQICIMGSRDQLCINDTVQAEKNSIIKNHMCRSEVKARKCSYYNEFEKNKNAFKSHYSTGQALDIEDLIAVGRKTKICPFFKSRENYDTADLFLMPYNYILDPNIRRTNKIELKGNILIFDEAHNLQKVCEESVSVSLSTKDLSGCIKEAQKTLKMILDDQEAVRGIMDESNAAFGSKEAKEEKSDTAELEIEPSDLAGLTERLQKFEEVLDELNLDVPHSEEIKLNARLNGKAFPGTFAKYLLNKADIDFSHREAIVNLADKVVSYLSVKNTMVSSALSSSWVSRGEALQKFGSFIATIFPVDEIGQSTAISAAKNGDLTPKQQQNFTVYIAREELPKGKVSLGRKLGLTLNYWCFSAGIGMKQLAEKEVRSMIITSGTLSPLTAFANEMKIPFRETLENCHVIGGEQVNIGIVTCGPDKSKLNGSFHNRLTTSYLNTVGWTLLNVCRVVPQGILVFFASYSHMETCLDYWRNRDMVLEALKKTKQVFFETRNKQEFQGVMQEFDKAVTENKGAVLFAVCRGKVSEGIDFSDCHGRAVIVVGIPYPPLMDPRVCLKRHFLDQNRDNSSSLHDDWYNTEAVRAVNQAIGRIIRHKDDFGAIILADIRFNRWDKSKFPAWLRSLVVEYNQFGELQKNLAGFFRSKGLLLSKSLENAREKSSKSHGVVTVRPKVSAEQRILYEKFHKEDIKAEEETEASFIRGVRETFSSTLVESKRKLSSESLLNKRPKKSGLDLLEFSESICSENLPGDVSLSSPSPCCSKAESRTESKSPEIKRKKIKLKRNETGTNANEPLGRSEGQKDEDKGEMPTDSPLGFLKLIKQELGSKKMLEFHKFVKKYNEKEIPIDEMLKHLADLCIPSHKSVFINFRHFVRLQDKNVYDEMAANML